MNCFQNQFCALPIPSLPVYGIFSDLDETYLPWDIHRYSAKCTEELENFIIKNQQKLIFVWITGSRFDQVIEKIKRYKVTLLPHFLASSMGTEIWTYDTFRNFWKKDTKWDKVMRKTGHRLLKVDKIYSTLKTLGIHLEAQTSVRSSLYKRSYYYFIENNRDQDKDLHIIKNVARENGIQVNISRCNLKIDNLNGYDIDFIPCHAGKDKVVQYFSDKFNLCHTKTYGFGDSGNDINMLQSVGNGYLVENATEEAKLKHRNYASGSYAQGILSVLKQNIE